MPFLGTAMADSITLTTAQNPLGIGLNQGFYTSAGAHSSSNSQTTTTSTQRSFFIFDLLLVGDSIIDSATLQIFNPSLSGATVQFFPVITPPSVVKLGGTSLPIYNDLGDGVPFSLSVPVIGTGYVSFALNGLAIAAMNGQDSYFGIGARLTSATGTAFGPAVTPQAAKLVLQTHAAPVPDSGATLALFGLAGAALAVLRRRL